MLRYGAEVLRFDLGAHPVAILFDDRGICSLPGNIGRRLAMLASSANPASLDTETD